MIDVESCRMRKEKEAHIKQYHPELGENPLFHVEITDSITVQDSIKRMLPKERHHDTNQENTNPKNRQKSFPQPGKAQILEKKPLIEQYKKRQGSRIFFRPKRQYSST